ncbi:tuftelin 1b isoform X2 [Synchiropus splendidus]|uniref:tuftelin 1b isoform X2 n=2 Tax=Synchiropus splendidus TaxID=270530 RepID=UPI00237D362E|nr:tuftelin 1b isoform X2 [Synchiropus splendidus]
MEALWRTLKHVTGEKKARWYLPERSEVRDAAAQMSCGAPRREHGDHNTRHRPELQRLTLESQSQSDGSDWNHKESSIAVVLPQKTQDPDEALITPTDDKAKVIKVFLENRPEAAQSVRMLTDEVSQIQEVRYCLKTLREQMAAKQSINNKKYPANGYHVSMHNIHPAVTNGNALHVDQDSHVENDEESATLRQATKRLYAQLKEMEKRHQEEVERLQVENNNYKVRIAEQSKRLRHTEEQSEEKSHQVEELQRLLGSLELESGLLKEKVAAGEAELLQLRAEREEEPSTERCEELEKEVAVLKEKLHHLDDMLKSQQRKVRHMIEQLQNSRTVIQERERFIRDLEEKMSFLEAENREMHDHMDYFLSEQEPPPLTSTEKKPQVIYSKQLMPTTHSSKSLPFIKVIEIKS